MEKSIVFTAACAALCAPAWAGETVTYSYDSLGRLAESSYSGTVNNGVRNDITYDAAGNRASYTTSGVAPLTMSVADATVSEGGNLAFTVTRGGATGTGATVNYATANGTATANSDYTAVSGTLAFAANETSKTVWVATARDGLIEGDEALSLVLSAPSVEYIISRGTATGTITDIPPPTMTVGNPKVTEGQNLVFVARLSAADAIAHTLTYTTQDRQSVPANQAAVAGSDYIATSGTVTFAPGDTTKTFIVNTIDDANVENQESMEVALGSDLSIASGAVSVGTITDNDTITTNSPPAANADSVSTPKCEAISVNVVANDTDPNGKYPIRLIQVGGIGTKFKKESDTNIRFDKTSTTGSFSTSYTIQNSEGRQATGTLTVTVTYGSSFAPNAVPTCQP